MKKMRLELLIILLMYLINFMILSAAVSFLLVVFNIIPSNRF